MAEGDRLRFAHPLLASAAYARLVAEETVRYSADAIGMAADVAAALVRRAGGQLETGRAAVSPIQDLELSGPVGSEALASFSLHNPRDQPATLSFVSGRFTGTLGDAASTVVLLQCNGTRWADVTPP